jgi:hypothetical protein
LTSDANDMRGEIAAAVAAAERALADQQALTVAVGQKAADVETYRRGGDEAKAEQAERELHALVDDHDRAVRSARAAAERVAELQTSLRAAGPEEGDLFGLVPAQTPLVFVPVRLQTRFKRVGARYELLVRMYPDDIHSDTFERELTDEEATWGKTFWDKTNAAADEQGRKAAWAELVGRFGPRRAAWVALAADPTAGPAARRAGAWTRAPQTRVLPDRWVVIGYAGGTRFTAVGNVVPDTLQTGPSPTGTDVPPASGLPPIDEGMRWMVEFAAAEQVGMGIRVPLDPGSETIDRLLVVGVKASLDEAAAAARLRDLLDAHHYTDGLALVPPGTPTNNTGGADAGYRSRDGVADTSYATERGAALVQPADRSDGALLAAALGIDAAVFAHVAEADGVTQQDARAMNAALWPATWRYFLSQMMADTFSESAVELGWPHFVEFVRGRGPLPALRTGRQPYGILPVTSLDRFRPLPRGRGSTTPATHGPPPVGAEADPLDGALADFLKRLRDGVWRRSLDGVPAVGRTGDADRDLAELLGQDAVSSRYAADWLLGGQYWINLWSFLGLGSPGWGVFSATTRAEGEAELAQVGVTWEPNLLDAVFWSWLELNGPHVESGAAGVDDESLSETQPLDDNYVTWLLASSIEAIRNETYPTKQPPNALLYLLLRHAVLLALATAAAAVPPTTQPALEMRAAAVDGALWKEAELVDIDPDEQTVKVWDHLGTPVVLGGVATQAAAVAEDVYRDGQGVAVPNAANLPTGPVFSELRAVGAALKHLEHRPTAALDRLMEETLDLGAHRLDAWITSLATKRLAQLRSFGVGGICLAGYGWVENLSPRGGAPAEPAAGEAPVVDTGNLGFVHAPSLGQAATAAVLRAGYLSHAGGSGNPFAIDLSSRRVRLARYLLEGVRQGQPLGALLGYLFERGLHERHARDPSLELDKFIVPFRKLAPLVAGKRDKADTGSVEAIAASNVVDGKTLLDLRASGDIVFGTDPLPTATGAERTAIDAELDALADALDAVADAVVAESVYQVVQGNPARAGATVEAIATGDAPPPELHVARTPRSGIGVTHRLLIGLGTGAAPAAIDPVAHPEAARADAEPELEAWAAALFGPPDKILCRARFEWSDPTGPKTATSAPIALSSLGMSALDVLYVTAPSAQEQRTELDQRVVAYALAHRPAAVPPSAQVRLDYTRNAAFVTGADELSFDELLELARTARELITAARPGDARDLVLPTEGGTTDALIDLADLQQRAGNAVQRLGIIRAAIDPAATDKNALRKAIAAAAALGVQGSVPASPVDGSLVSAVDGRVLDELQALRTQAQSVADELGRRTAALAALAQPAAGADAKTKVAYEFDRIAIVLGRGFKVVPRFTASNATELAKSFGDSTGLQGGDAGAAATWFTRAARVRDGVARLEGVLQYAAALGRSGHEFRVGQLPYAPNDRWVALPAAAGGAVAGGRLSLVAHADTAFPTPSLAALIVDEWVEVVPSAVETTGVTFHFDAPAAEPPQALLVGVHPDPIGAREGAAGGRWDLATVEAILLETLDLASLRGVDSDALRNAGQFLPAAYFADNAAGDTVSTDFRRNVVTPKGASA